MHCRYHTGAGSVSLDLTSCKSEIISADNSKFTAHGWLMALGWGVVIPLGTVFASATRSAWLNAYLNEGAEYECGAGEIAVYFESITGIIFIWEYNLWAWSHSL